MAGGYLHFVNGKEEASNVPPSFPSPPWNAGIDISYLQHQLGHSSRTTTAIYLQARPTHSRKAYEKTDFDGLLNPHAERL